MGKTALVEGEVVFKSGSNSMIDFYEESFDFSDEVETLAQARQILHAGLCADRLRKSVKGFRRVRTCQVVEFKDNEKSPSKDQSDYEKLLVKATKLGCVPDSFERYTSEKGRGKALTKAIELHEKRLATAKKGDVKEGKLEKGFV